MNTIFDSASALQRFRNRHNLQLSSPNHASSYILTCKIRKVLHREFTDEVLARYLNEFGFVENSKVDRIDKINQLLLRLEKLEAVNMKIIWQEYDENGIWGLVVMLNYPLSKLTRLTTERRKYERELVTD